MHFYQFGCQNKTLPVFKWYFPAGGKWLGKRTKRIKNINTTKPMIKITLTPFLFYFSYKFLH